MYYTYHPSHRILRHHSRTRKFQFPLWRNTSKHTKPREKNLCINFQLSPHFPLHRVSYIPVNIYATVSATLRLYALFSHPSRNKFSNEESWARRGGQRVFIIWRTIPRCVAVIYERGGVTAWVEIVFASSIRDCFAGISWRGGCREMIAFYGEFEKRSEVRVASECFEWQLFRGIK